VAFGNISTLYLPIAANAGSSQWGTDVRKLLDAADGTSDSTTTTNHGTGGQVTRTADPYSASSTDGTEANFGWAVTPSDMNSVAGARRFYPAGNHVATVRLGHNGALAANATLTMFAYRVGNAAGGRARTLLGSATSASIQLPAASGQATFTVTLALGEVIFEVDETIQYSFEIAAPGVAITGKIVTLFTGTTSSVVGRVDTPTLKVLADTTGTSNDSVGTASGVVGKVLNTTGTSNDSVGTASGALGAQAALAGAASGSGAASGVLNATAGLSGTAGGVADALAVVGASAGLVGSANGAGSSSGVLGATAGLVGLSGGGSEASGSLSAFAAMSGSSAGTCIVLGQPSSLSGTTGSASGTGAGLGVMGAVVGTVGTVNIGGDAPSDYSPNDEARSITGEVLHHETGAPIEAATVRLIRDSDGLLCATGSTGPGGLYTFLRGSTDPNTYHVTADYDDAGTQVHGISDRGLVPS
jgi:hypothetical protein